MISLILENPTPGAIRSLLNQDWDRFAPLYPEIHFITRPGSVGDVAARAVSWPGPVVFHAPPTEPVCPPWDGVISAIRAATMDWVWVIPPGIVPAPRSLTDIHHILTARSDAKIHLFHSFASQMIPEPITFANATPDQLFTPRTITAECAVLPRGLAQLATFISGDFGDVAWLAEAHRLHPSGDDSLVRHHILIAANDREPPIRESRISAPLDSKFGFPFTTEHTNWVFHPDPDMFPLAADTTSPCAALALDFVNPEWVGIFPVVFPGWENQGIYRPLIHFAMLASGGRPLSIVFKEPLFANVPRNVVIALMRDLRFRPGNSLNGFVHPGLVNSDPLVGVTSPLIYF